ncbi:MAG: OmpA family protein, partial [bacterium]
GAVTAGAGAAGAPGAAGEGPGGAARAAPAAGASSRGSREYNLALGQRRADAVRQAMSVLGVTERQMEPVSLGEERPRASGSTEAAYAENRRADILYDGEDKLPAGK